MNHRTKTSLSITVQPDETALVQLKWSSKDQLRPKEEVAKDLLSHLINLPDYLWLRPFFDKEMVYLR